MEEQNQNLNIVIVDDDPAIRHVCETILKRNYPNTRTFDNASDALTYIKQNSVDIALVDLKMPGISGHELISRISELNKDIVILVITAYASIENAIEAMQKGASDFLPKPFTPDELRLAVKKASDRRELIRQRAKALEEKMEMEENYLSFISHQLKSPLSAAQQLLYLIEEGSYKIEEEAFQIIKRANRRISEALGLVNEWLLVSKMEKAGFTQNFKTVDIVPIINSEIEKYDEQIKLKNISLFTEMNTSTFIDTDPSSFAMIISNLISNAIKYNINGGKIIVRLKEENDYITLEVEDTGIGIKKEFLPRLFSKFFRIRDEKTRNIEGTGLGLAIVKKIVEEHRGDIRVISDEGKGTRFIITLPRRH